MSRVRQLGATLHALGACWLLLNACWGCGPGPRSDAEGELRVIVRSDPIQFLPRQAHPLTLDRDLADALAERLRRPLHLVPVEDYSEMIDRLLAGDGDMVAASLTATEARERRVSFSKPYLHTDELLILRRDGPEVTVFDDLDGLEICVRPSSSYAETLQALRTSVPGVVIQPLPETTDTEGAIALVAEGECQATIADAPYWAALSVVFEELHAPLTVAENRPIALAFRPEDRSLRRRADDLIVARQLTKHRDRVYHDDLPGLQRRGRLRMLTRNNPLTYYLHRGRQMGFEYRLMERFAEAQGLELEVVVPPAREDLDRWLLEGRGDVVAAGLTATPSRRERLAFTRPYMEVDEVLVVAPGGPSVESLDDLRGLTIHIRRSSSYYETLTEHLELPEGVRVETVSEDLETDAILERVESGEWQATVADSSILDAERTYGRDVEPALTLREGVEIAWAVRPGNDRLLEAFDRYLAAEHRGLHYNIWRERYFEDVERLAEARGAWRSDIEGRISPYDDVARAVGSEVGIDWRLLVAVMLQESAFDADRISPAGARGLMQMLPRTAREVGVRDLFDPEQAIRGGALYLDQLRDRFEPGLTPVTRMRFALASYNAGHGHVTDARRLARREGISPDRWYDNVERAILLLQKPRYYRHSVFGYCRGGETVSYVANVDRFYRIFVEQVPDG